MKFVRQRLRKDWDCVIGVTGRSGTGKSTMVIGWLAKLIDQSFTMEKNVCFIPEGGQILTMFKSINRYGCFVIDEAARALHKHGWADKVQQSVNLCYDTERFQNKCTFMLMPRWSSFNENFRNFRIDIWIDIIERGRAIVYLIDRDKDNFDPWHIQENLRIKKKFFKFKNIAQVGVEHRIAAERRLMNYGFDFRYPDWESKTEKDAYEDLKVKSRVQLEDTPEGESKEKWIMWKRRWGALATYLINAGMTKTAVGGIAGMSYEATKEAMKKTLDKDIMKDMMFSEPLSANDDVARMYKEFNFTKYIEAINYRQKEQSA